MMRKQAYGDPVAKVINEILPKWRGKEQEFLDEMHKYWKWKIVGKTPCAILETDWTAVVKAAKQMNPNVVEPKGGYYASEAWHQRKSLRLPSCK